MKDLSKTEEIILLAILQLGDQAYGFKIRQHVSQVLEKDFTYGNLYSVLNQLVKKKFVKKRPGESTDQRQGKIRMYYSLSEAGLEALKEAYHLNRKLWTRIYPSIFNIKDK